MIKTLALYVCPVPGCPKLGSSGSRCPRHDKLLIREIYIHKGGAPSAGLRDLVDGLFKGTAR